MDDARALNRAHWDERVGIHLASGFYDVEQWHFGLDTPSWARLGARVTGLDFSAAAIEAARSLAGDAPTAPASGVVDLARWSPGPTEGSKVHGHSRTWTDGNVNVTTCARRGSGRGARSRSVGGY